MIEVKKSVSELWANMVQLLEERSPGISICFNPPANESELMGIEKKMGLTLPQELRQLYLCNNGQNENGMGILSGLDFLPLEELYIQWEIWRVLKEGATKEQMKILSERCSSFPFQAIKKIYTNEGWLPMTHDGAGNHIGVDLDPDCNGNVGQIINFGRDEDQKFVIARNLREYLTLVIGWIEGGYLEVYEKEGLFVIQFKDHRHPVDNYRELLANKN